MSTHGVPPVQASVSFEKELTDLRDLTVVHLDPIQDRLSRSITLLENEISGSPTVISMAFAIGRTVEELRSVRRAVYDALVGLQQTRLDLTVREQELNEKNSNSIDTRTK